jgi:MFS family permease
MQPREIILKKVRPHFFYGWVVLGVATIAMFATGPGQSHTFSIFVDLIARDLNINSTTIASSYAFATLIAALGLTRMGRFVDRFGARKVLIAVIIFLGLSCFAFGAAIGVITLSLGFMVLRFFGQGSMMLGSSNLVAQWFNRRRGFAMSVMMLGFAASIAIHPLLAQWLIDVVGWRQAWSWLGLMSWALMLPLLLLLVFDKPEPLGLKPDGDMPDPISDRGAQPAKMTGLSLHAAIRTPAFWIIAAGLMTPAMLITSLFFFQVSIFEQHGLSRGFAAQMFAVSSIAMALSMPLVGWVLDHSNPKYVFSASLALLACSLVTVTFVEDLSTGLLYAIIFGVNTAANMTFFGYMWAQYFGRLHLGSIQGVGQTIGVIGASVGPLPLGIAFDYVGSYDGALHYLAVIPIACSILALFLVAPVIPAVEDTKE